MHTVLTDFNLYVSILQVSRMDIVHFQERHHKNKYKQNRHMAGNIQTC